LAPEEIPPAQQLARAVATRQAALGKIDPHTIEALREGAAEAVKHANSMPPVFDSAQLRRITSEARDLAISLEPVEKQTSPAPAKPARRRIKRIPPDEHLARRVVKRHRTNAIAFLKRAELTDELRELIEVETRLGKGTRPDCKHAAYSARNLMEGVANHLFPATSKPHLDRDDRKHSLGATDHKNRLIAYVDQHLRGHWEGHDFRAFIGTMDALMRWTGSGPHGGYKLEDAEHSYIRMLDALAVVARAHTAASASTP
jgi:hypothetical protein